MSTFLFRSGCCYCQFTSNLYLLHDLETTHSIFLFESVERCHFQMAVQVITTMPPVKMKRQESSRCRRPIMSKTKFEMLPPEVLNQIFTYVTLPFEQHIAAVHMPRKSI